MALLTYRVFEGAPHFSIVVQDSDAGDFDLKLQLDSEVLTREAVFLMLENFKKFLLEQPWPPIPETEQSV